MQLSIIAYCDANQNQLTEPIEYHQAIVHGNGFYPSFSAYNNIDVRRFRHA